jgi:dTDP-L-rhamnose 4-epimerase
LYLQNLDGIQVKSKVLVTGGAGFIGSHTVDLLLEKGYDVRVLDNLQPRVHPRGKPDYLPREAEFIQGDVADRDDLDKALSGVSRVIHLAAYQDYLPDFSTFIHTNAESSALLFELIVEKRLPVEKIVFASSQSVSGEGRYECSEHGTIHPESRSIEQLRMGDWEVKCPICGAEMKPLLIDEKTVQPHTAYAISKYAIELLARNLGHRYAIPTACMRYTYVQGTRNSFYNAYSGIARRFALRLLHGLAPICYEDGKQLRDYVNVKDIARANVLVMEDARADFEVFNAGGGRAVTVLEFAQIMIKEFGGETEPIVPGDFRLGDTRHTVSDNSKLNVLGWEPLIPVEQNVREYVEWMRGQKGTAQYLEEAERVMREQGVVQSVENR